MRRSDSAIRQLLFFSLIFVLFFLAQVYWKPSLPKSPQIQWHEQAIDRKVPQKTNQDTTSEAIMQSKPTSQPTLQPTEQAKELPANKTLTGKRKEPDEAIIKTKRANEERQILLNNTKSLRSSRFPSFEERLKIYTSYWYLPPCPNTKKNQTKTYFQFHPIENYRGVKVKPPLSNGTVFSLKPETIAGKVMVLDAKYMLTKNALEKNLPIERYYMEFLRNIELHWFDLDKNEKTDMPMIMRFGDAIHPYIGLEVAKFPFLSKTRPAMDAESLTRITTGKCLTPEERGPLPYPILHLLGETRHINPVYRIQRLDIPWDDKIPTAIFRGALTGTRDPDPKVTTIDHKIEYLFEGNNRMRNAEVFCKYRPRCQFVKDYKNSSLIDARLMRVQGEDTRGFYEDFYTGEVVLQDILKYKVIVVIEGNDVATSLKWALYSSSLVMMAEPTVTSWAMEERLVPWFHYVPLNPRMTDAEEKMQWVLDHEDEARKISEQGTIYMHDLMFHEDAREESERIKEEILRRMRAHFEASPEPLV